MVVYVSVAHVIWTRIWYLDSLKSCRYRRILGALWIIWSINLVSIREELGGILAQGGPNSKKARFLGRIIPASWQIFWKIKVFKETSAVFGVLWENLAKFWSIKWFLTNFGTKIIVFFSIMSYVMYYAKNSKWSTTLQFFDREKSVKNSFGWHLSKG